jgi:CDP-glucose 4,6-dehydratase
MVNPEAAFWRGRRVLVTGHTGFKGTWLCLWLQRLGAEVSGLALAPATTPNLFTLALKSDQIRSVVGDIRDPATVQRCFGERAPEVVFHLAAQALVGTSYQDPVATYATNVMGTVNLLEAARGSDGVKAVVVVTSDKCYRNREWLWAYREDEPMGGKDPYSSSKACAELVTEAYRSSFFAEGRCRIASARAGNVIGGGDWSENRLVPDLIRAFARNASAGIRSPGAVRPWQHVLDPLCGYLRLAECLASDAGRDYAEGFNFGPADEDCRPVSYVVEKLAAGWGERAAWHRSDRTHFAEAGNLKVDSTKARAFLNWDPRLRIDAALEWTVSWYHRQLRGGDAARLSLEQIEAYERLSVPGS